MEEAKIAAGKIWLTAIKLGTRPSYTKKPQLCQQDNKTNTVDKSTVCANYMVKYIE